MGRYPAKLKIDKNSVGDRIRVLILGSLAGVLLRVLALTWRWHRVEGLEHVVVAAADGPVICTFWHAQQLVMPNVLRLMRSRCQFQGGMKALHSLHADGRISGRAISLSGIGGIPGSSTRGGDAALRQLVRALARGESVAMTPDGPRGPERISKMGVIRLAQISGRPILPMACVATKRWVFGSWDRMFLPKFFSELVVEFSAPIFIPRRVSEEDGKRMLLELDAQLQLLTQRVDQSASSRR